ncbi:MAG: Rv3235 family protein [Bifidobacteriaceae bacterium]|jgi:hypothetical protein|nr:Rv3235 family protein [Bifidobacteriaceae bacterium]
MLETAIQADAAMILDAQGRPDPKRWAGALVLSAGQATRGLRPPIHLHRWVSESVFEMLESRARVAKRMSRGRRPKDWHLAIRSSHCNELVPGIVQASVVMDDGARVRGVAVRLEWRRNRWLATELTVLGR